MIEPEWLHDLFHQHREHVMSAINDLTNAVAANTAAVTAAIHAVQVLNAQVQTQPAPGVAVGIPEADVAALAATVTADAARLQQALEPMPQDFKSASMTTES